MYKNSFYIKNPVWNNAFSFEKRKNKELYVANLTKIQNLEEIKLWEKIVFEDFNFNWELESCKWLNNFYEIEWNNKKIYLFDNHNHAYYFWYLARDLDIIWDNNILYHIDEHSDMRDPKKYLLKPESFDLEKVFDYTNNFLNVGNYIIPAIKEWIISEVIQIRNESNLKDFTCSESRPVFTTNKQNIILNLDLDFFQPDLDFIDYELKKKVVLDIAKKATIITVASSPFFINQDLAIKVFKDLFS